MCVSETKYMVCLSQKALTFRTGTGHNVTKELKQPRRRRQQEGHKFAYLTMKNNSFARLAGAFLIFVHFVDVLVLSAT